VAPVIDDKSHSCRAGAARQQRNSPIQQYPAIAYSRCIAPVRSRRARRGRGSSRSISLKELLAKQAQLNAALDQDRSGTQVVAEEKGTDS